MYIGLRVKYPPYFLHFNKTWISSTDFPKNTQIPNFMKIRPEGSELFHADRRTNRHDNAISLFCAILRTRLKYSLKSRNRLWKETEGTVCYIQMWRHPVWQKYTDVSGGSCCLCHQCESVYHTTISDTPFLEQAVLILRTWRHWWLTQNSKTTLSPLFGYLCLWKITCNLSRDHEFRNSLLRKGIICQLACLASLPLHTQIS